jgi:hypothetical protein
MDFVAPRLFEYIVANRCSYMNCWNSFSCSWCYNFLHCKFMKNIEDVSIL